MKGRMAGIALAALLGGCGGPKVNLQDLLPFPPAATGARTGDQAGAETVAKASSETTPETGSVSQSLPQETGTLVPGTPTGVFADVARGALGCWFAADGPLKASHVYRAEAQPPAKGGDAQIVIHERDDSMRDLRGLRAYRITFSAELTSVRVTMTALRFEAKIAQAMARDVESWAKGGQSCQLREVLPPPAPPKTAKSAKGAKTAKAAKGKPAAKGPTATGDKTR